jgi:hypothetical protein
MVTAGEADEDDLHSDTSPSPLTVASEGGC